MDVVKKNILPTLIVTLVLLTLYFLFFLLPQIRLVEKLNKAEAELALHHTNLVQNRLAYIALTRLDPNSANFQAETANIIETLQETRKEGLELVKEKNNIPNLKNFDINFPKLVAETESVYRQQEELIKKVTETEKYEDGLVILKSDEAVNLLTKQTNLILEYEYWLEKIKSSQD